MAKNFKDAIVPETGREYEQTTLPSGNIQLEDVTEYTQVGSTLTAGDLLEGLQQVCPYSEGVLTAYGTVGRFKAPETERITTITIPGSVEGSVLILSVKAGRRTDVLLTGGLWYIFVIDLTDQSITIINEDYVPLDGGSYIGAVNYSGASISNDQAVFRNEIVVASGTDPSTLDVPTGTIINILK